MPGLPRRLVAAGAALAVASAGPLLGGVVAVATPVDLAAAGPASHSARATRTGTVVDGVPTDQGVTVRLR